MDAIGYPCLCRFSCPEMGTGMILVSTRPGYQRRQSTPFSGRFRLLWTAREFTLVYQHPCRMVFPDDEHLGSGGVFVVLHFLVRIDTQPIHAHLARMRGTFSEARLSWTCRSLGLFQWHQDQKEKRTGSNNKRTTSTKSIILTRSPGPWVPWSSGPLVRWSFGPLVRWSPGPSVSWSATTLVPFLVR